MSRLGARCTIGAAAVTALAAAASAGATTYPVVRATDDEVTVLDPASMEMGAGDVRRARTVTVQRNLISGGPPAPGYVRTDNEYDCAAHTGRWRTLTAYSRLGAVVLQEDNRSSDWRPAASDPALRAALRIVCDGVDSGQVFSASSIGALVLSLMQAWDPTPVAVTPPAVLPAHAAARRGRRPKP